MFIFERVRDIVWAGGGAEREREAQNLKQAPGSELSAQSPTRGSNSQTARSWPERKSDAQLTEPPRRPSGNQFLIFAGEFNVWYHVIKKIVIKANTLSDCRGKQYILARINVDLVIITVFFVCLSSKIYFDFYHFFWIFCLRVSFLDCSVLQDWF